MIRVSESAGFCPGVRRAAECFKMRLRKLKGAGRCVTNAVRFLFL